ncbi:hypothetical protein [Blastococcus sp. CCUG 61487]|uniref:hypothetical protein n=1 Tax=Blastococcus sp. CCUG 61487 TaxID=1840703 RepID=UPI0010C1095C|nr:hypothetical protein [Blastococcus sp. CCUG 61487]TKJ30151.1 hypothetical protein A6V29_19005 [Blastococcus sp. CCUG 61487]
MSAEAIIALVAVVVSVAAVIVSVVAARYAKIQAHSASRSAEAAVEQAASARDQASAARDQVAAARDQVAAAQRQNELQEQARRDAAQPYVVVDVVPDDAQGQLLQVVARNLGQTMARNVQVQFDPPLPKRLGSEQGPFLALAQGISYLPPGRSMTWNLGVSFNYFEEDTAPPITQVTVTCVGPFGPTDPLTYAVSFEEFRHQSARAVGSLHRVERSIDKLTAAVTKVVQRR